MVVFAFPPYSPEPNKIKNTFWRLKNKILFKNLNNKEYRGIIIEELRISIRNIQKNMLIMLKVIIKFWVKWKLDSQSSSKTLTWYLTLFGCIR